MSQSEKPTVKAVTVRNYKPIDALSEETVAFTAQIRLDGRAAGTVRNQGTGGAHKYDFETRSDREAFLAYAESWARNNGVTGSPAEALIDQLCEDYQLTNEARALLKLRTNTVILIETGPVWITEDHSGTPAYYSDRQLLVVPDGEDPAALAAEKHADAWRVIPTD